MKRRKSINCTEGRHAARTGCPCPHHVAPPPEPDGPSVPPTNEVRAELERVRAGRKRRAEERAAELAAADLRERTTRSC